MDWINQIRGVLGKYAGGSPEQPGPQPGVQHVADDSAVHRDFEQVAQKAPRSSFVQALADTFRGNDTPPFSDMVAHLFSRSNPEQKAGLLNRLITVSPASAADELLRLIGPNREVTTQEAANISPDIVKKIAGEAEKQVPSAVDRVSEYYAEHPNLVKTLGIGSLVSFMRRIGGQLGERQSGGGAGA